MKIGWKEKFILLIMTPKSQRTLFLKERQELAQVTLDVILFDNYEQAL